MNAKKVKGVITAPLLIVAMRERDSDLGTFVIFSPERDSKTGFI